MTQVQLASLCDVRQQTIVHWELDGNKPVKASTRAKLEAALGAPIDVLLKENGDTENSAAAAEPPVTTQEDLLCQV
jgi:transcriptional regulator with XRE-family HTH domain